METEVLEKPETQSSNETATNAAGDQNEGAGQASVGPIEQLQQELAAEKARADDNYDKLQRAVADAINARRRMEKRLEDEIALASSAIIKRLLPVLDDLDLAFRNTPDSMPDEISAWFNGFKQIQKKLDALLEEQNVIKFVDTGILDPTRHEAVFSEPHDTIESGHIIDTMRPGYEIKGRILRPALVKVAA